MALASFISLTVDQVDIVNTVNKVNGINEVNGINSPALAGSTRPATTKLLISMPLYIINLTARSKASDIQAIARHFKTQ